MKSAPLLAVLFFAACSVSEPGLGVAPAAKPKPHLLALSTYAASVGTVIDAYAERLPAEAGADIRIVFSGTFTTDDGTNQSVPVDLEVGTRRLDAGTVRWTSFGPYGNPFGAGGSETGVFQGTAAVRIRAEDGSAIDDPSPAELHFQVLPSVIVRELEPATASCSGGIKRALGGVPYRIKVEAAGFVPAAFTYTFSNPAHASEPIAVRHLAQGRFDAAGEHGDIVMPPVPDGIDSYSAIVTAGAMDDKNAYHQTAFAIEVHRPLEVYYNGNLTVAEILAPVPVSGCIPGGEAGRDVSYNETMEETRMRTYELNWNQSWLDTHTVSQGSMNMIGTSETNGVGFSTSDGTNWNWSLGGEVSGSVGIEDLVQVGVKVNGSVGGGGMHSSENSSSRSTGVDASTTTTETSEASSQRGGQQGGGFSWQVSSEQSISHQFGGHVIAKTYGVFYRQALRLLRRAAVVTYNQCGAASVVADLDFQDWTWSPDLALGSDCPPLPTSNLPKAQCVVAPCSTQ